MKRILTILLITAIGMITQYGCKVQKQPDVSGIVTFKLGTVQIQQPDGQKKDLEIKDRVSPGDTISTGPLSALVIQFAENCLVRVEESTTFKVISSAGKDRELFVRSGQVLTKLIRTGDNNATIKTPTAVAGVRGTQFSVNYTDGKTRIAVTEGKVAVKASKQDESGKVIAESKEEMLTQAGSTAEVTAPAAEKVGEKPALAVNLRPITPGEQEALKRIESMPVIPEPEKKKPQEIETSVKDAIEKSKEDEAKTRKDKVKAIMEKKTRSMAEIRDVFNRIDEITLYNGRTIQGAIVSRGANYVILTTGGTVSIPEKDIKNSRILK